MKKIYTVLIVVFAFVFITNVQAQEKSISGTVSSKLDGTTLPGVSIVVQGTARGTETDFDTGSLLSADFRFHQGCSSKFNDHLLNQFFQKLRT